jgi:hypothetical protein
VASTKNTDRRDECHGGLLFPPERFQLAMRGGRRKGNFKFFCDKNVARMPIAAAAIAGTVFHAPTEEGPSLGRSAPSSTMKCDAMNSNKPRSRSSRPASHRRRLERLLKQILAGKVSIHSAAELANELTALPYRRVVE